MSNRNRNRNRSNNRVEADAAETTDANTATVISTVADPNEDAIEAALAAIDAEANEQAEVISLAEVEVVVIDQTASAASVDVATEADEIEELLAQAEAASETSDENEDAAVEEPVEAVEAVSQGDVQEVIENDADALLAELEADDGSAAPTTTATKPKRQPKSTSAATTTPAAPKRDFHSIAQIDKPTLNANLDACNAKKVIEKAQNLIQAIEVGKKLSRYTSVAIKRLVSDGKITGKSLVDALEGEGLSIGTARAQAQQMTALFQIAGIAQKDATAPKELVIADKGLADELMKLAA